MTNEIAGMENDGLENDGVEQEQTYILHPMKNFNVRTTCNFFKH